jgi:hypothetical protein
MFGLFRKREVETVEVVEPAKAIWLSADDIRNHFSNLGRSGCGLLDTKNALSNGDLEGFVRAGGTLVDLRPYARQLA